MCLVIWPALDAQLPLRYRCHEVLYASKAALVQPDASSESAGTISQTHGVSRATEYRMLAEDGKHER